MDSYKQQIEVSNTIPRKVQAKSKKAEKSATILPPLNSDILLPQSE